MNTGQSVVGFRDSAYLYYPYFKWIDQQWANGDLPLWNPYCDYGYPVVGDGGSSVFYPGKLIFFLWFLDYPVRYGWYLSSHVLLAIFGAYFLARRFGANQIGASVSGIAYGFGGSVLFQVCNVIYLVGAAWLPLGLAAIWAMSKSSQLKYSIASAVIAALMILGGDPQMAYLLASIGIVTSGWSLFRRRYRLGRRKLFLCAALQCLKRLAVFGVLTFLLASIQLMPTYEWATTSSRAMNDLDLVSLSLNSGHRGLDAVYQFSQPPWTLAELVWPNVSGKPYPTHRRWSDILPGAERFWTPSLYVGLLTLFCGLSAIRLWGRSKRRIWLSLLGIVFAIGSFGWFGLMWLLREIAFQFDLQLPQESDELASYVGGLYWLATLLLPKFFMFRFPAKLFVVASLALCVLAGIQFSSRNWQKIKILAALVFFLSLATYVALPHVWPAPAFHRTLPEILNWQGLFGPLDWQGSLEVVRSSILQTIIISAVIFVMTFSNHQMMRLALVGVLICEILVANHWLIPQVDADVFESEVKIASDLEEMEWDESKIRSVIWRPTLPQEFADVSSDDRLAELVLWQRENLHPKHHLELPIALFGSFTSIEPGDTNWFEPVFFSSVFEDSVSQFPGTRFRLVSPDADLKNLGYGSHIQSGGIEVLNVSCNQLRLKIYNGAPAKFVFMVTSAGWEVELKDLSKPKQVTRPELERADRRTAFQLPAGEFEIKFSYNPREFWIGMWISSASWFALIGWFLYALRSRRAGKAG